MSRMTRVRRVVVSSPMWCMSPSSRLGRRARAETRSWRMAVSGVSDRCPVGRWLWGSGLVGGGWGAGGVGAIGVGAGGL